VGGVNPVQGRVKGKKECKWNLMRRGKGGNSILGLRALMLVEGGGDRFHRSGGGGKISCEERGPYLPGGKERFLSIASKKGGGP